MRPTSDKVRQAIFNILMHNDFGVGFSLEGARVADLFAGTGALGIEALSRGAANVQFVERDARAVQALRANLERLKTTGGQVAAAEAGLFLQGAPQPQDLVFLDPPFALGLWTTLAQQLEQGGWLAAQAWIYVESPRGSVPALPLNWRLHREGHAGEVHFALYQR